MAKALKYANSPLCYQIAFTLAEEDKEMPFCI